MLRTTRSVENLLLSIAEDTEIGNIGGDGDCEDETVEISQLTSKNLNGVTNYLTPSTKRAFTQLRQAFTKVPIFQHFDLECHIRIETNAFGYAIDGALGQLTSDNSGQWYLIAFYSQKMIPAKTWYKTHNDKLLTIVEAFKIWRHT